MKNINLLVGLGNVGLEYETTRHNFGFLLLDQIIEDYGFTKIADKKFHSEIFSGKINDKKIIAIKPHTFMNRSGIAVAEVANFYKIDLHQIIALHDDIDLELGRVKVKIGGGNAGHNGLKSLDEFVGKNYMRLRLGVSRPENKEYEVADYVLGKFNKAEMEWVGKINCKISDVIDELLEGREDKFLNEFYGKVSV